MIKMNEELTTTGDVWRNNERKKTVSETVDRVPEGEVGFGTVVVLPEVTGRIGDQRL